MYSVIALKILQQVEYFIDYKNALIKLLFRLMIQNTVSYTHLDVYKRQASGCRPLLEKIKNWL